MTFYEEAKQHEGHLVSVMLDRDDPRARAMGKLISLSIDGEAIIDIDFQQRRYCWPVLEMKCEDCREEVH